MTELEQVKRAALDLLDSLEGTRSASDIAKVTHALLDAEARGVLWQPPISSRRTKRAAYLRSQVKRGTT